MYSSYCAVSEIDLIKVNANWKLNRITSDTNYNAIDSKDVLIGQSATFSDEYGSDLLSECRTKELSTKCIINTDGGEITFTDRVPYIMTVKKAKEDETTATWHRLDNHYILIDVYIASSHGLNNMDIGDTNCNWSVRVAIQGPITKYYNAENFIHICNILNPFIKTVRESEKKERFTIGINITHLNNIMELNKTFTIDNWNKESTKTWPRCIRRGDLVFVIAQYDNNEYTAVKSLEDRVINKPKEGILRDIYESAIDAYLTGGKAIQSYNVQSSIALQMAEQAKWATLCGISLVLETCGIEISDKPFSMVKVDLPHEQYYLRTTSIGKGDGLPLMSSKAWDIMFPSTSLKGMSRSPMSVANSILYNNIVYGNELGRLMGPVDNLFFYDYAVESRDKKLNTWFAGVRHKVATNFQSMTPLQATSTLGNVMAYEMIKAKCRVEETSRKLGQINHKMAVWNDLRSMLHYRVVDAAFLKIVPYGMLTNDEMDVIGFATLLHDMVDFGYDLSVKESSNTFFSFVKGKLDRNSIIKGFISMANGLQYVIENYKYDACGLTFLATHYWQMANGRHRIVPSIFNGATDYEHVHLDFAGGDLLSLLKGDLGEKRKDTKLTTMQYGEEIRKVAKLVGPDAVAMADLVTVDMMSTYLGRDQINIDNIERRMCELSVSLAIGCEVNGKTTSFLWMICEFMWLRTGMMLSCLLGSMKVAHHRRQSDDRGGLNYKWVHKL